MIRSFRGCATAALLCSALTVGACGKKPPATAPPPPPPPRTGSSAGADQARAAAGAAPAPPPAPRTPTEDEIFAKWTVEELNKQGLLADVFFALDSVELNPESRATIQKNTEFLKRRTSTKIMVEGHADSRGTNEYNLALAERRAGAVRDYLVSLGIPADRITIVSKGEEAPFCTEESESCWQQNRRGHFVFTAK